jgi:UDP-4-amino-4,6-dideoxy-N-acetyl-beta-L-altrosamine transaminase
MVAIKYFYGRQFIDRADIESMIESLQGDMISPGPSIARFEEKVAEYCGAQYCIAVSSGSAGLHLACMALGLEKSSIGWTVPLTFVASANAIRYTGASVDFVDIDADTFTISPILLEQKLVEAKDQGNLPRVIIPVHFAGQTCDMTRIRQLSEDYAVPLIEDACQALGAEYAGGKIGNCQYSEVTVFSLHPVKSITTGEGGLVLTNDKIIADFVRQARSHGIEKNPPGGAGPWHAEMFQEGLNYRITDFQCALGLSQMDKLDKFIDQRRKLAERYMERLTGLSLKFQKPNPDGKSAWHLMVVEFDFAKIGKDKIKVFEELAARSIHLAVHYYPSHLHSFYRHLGFEPGMYPASERYYERAFSLPLHPSLQLADVDHICSEIEAVVG